MKGRIRASAGQESRGRSMPQRQQTDRDCAIACRQYGQAANAARDCRCAGRYFAAQCQAPPMGAVPTSIIIRVVVSSAAIASPHAAHAKCALCRRLCRRSGHSCRGRKVLGCFVPAQGGRSWGDQSDIRLCLKTVHPGLMPPLGCPPRYSSRYFCDQQSLWVSTPASR